MMATNMKNAAGVTIAILVGVISALLAPLVTGQLTQAGAADEYQPCANQAIETAIYEVTGEHTGQMSGAGLACNPFLYNKGQWSSTTELKHWVTQVMNRCGTTAEGRLLVLALLETTGIPPKAGGDNVCNRAVYEQWWEDVETYESPGVNWTKYVGGAYPSSDVYSAVAGVMSVCFQSVVSHAVVSVTNRYPITSWQGAAAPNHLVNSGLGARGQCDSALYRNGAWTSYDDLRNRVVQRATSTTVCQDNNIQAAYQNLTGWSPLPEECEAWRYGNGSWSGYQDLLNRVYHSLRCSEPWLGQFIAYDIASPHRARGRGYAVGECTTALYHGLWVSYADAKQKVQSVHGALVQAGAAFESSGDIDLNGVEYDATQVRTGSVQGSSVAGSTGGAAFRSDNGSPVKVQPMGGSPVIATGGGNVIATGGGNVIATGGGNVIATGGGNLIGQAGGN